MVAIRRTELTGIKDQVKRMGNPVETAAAWAYTWLGAAIAVAVSLGALYGANSEPDTNIAGWVFLAHWFALLSFAFLAWFSWRFDQQRRQSQQTDKDVLVREIETIENRYPATAD